MIQHSKQVSLLSGFFLLEYLRSGRFLLELSLVIACFVVFLRPTGTPIRADNFFTVSALFGPVLAVLITSAIIGLGDRPQAYIILAHSISRGVYLISLFCAACAAVLIMYGILCLLVALFNPVAELDLIKWFLATLPLSLNIGLISILTLLLSPLILGTGWRLFVLALIALALSSNVIGGPLLNQIEEINPFLITLLRAVQTLLSGPLVPIFYGYQLSIIGNFDNASAWANLLAQGSLLLAFLGLAYYAFNRRDLIFSVS
ncbi:hypothetical protein [Chloroflexus sp. Y-396-1]|jgi:ABC-type transport system involved in multi-copper enzyme maturation permease subunit|uniref:hypothetical protein n=1 Tax=Chloroflexus sp. Y-396-1 TaxID=867845 RepID=UPI00048AA158|nr:hypothetical protein [Chloroflexus sp. Y-396-1]